MKVFGTTANFVIKYDDSFSDAVKGAAAVYSIVESEFAVLTGWFGITSGFGPSHVVTVALDRTDFGGVNNGYDSGGLIHLQIQQGVTDDIVAAERTKSFFVAEFVEILMDYRNQHGPESWNPAHSDGEGLSRFCARERFRVGYDTAFSFVEVNTWLNSPRNNFIDSPENTDKEGLSIALSMLFIYFLRSQLNFQVDKIIQSGGENLEKTYTALTGSTNGYMALRNVIDPFYPPGADHNAADDNIFPLYDVAHRHADLSIGYAQLTPWLEVGSSSAPVYLLGCGRKTYSFQILAGQQEALCTAKAVGFAMPRFEWRINGATPLPDQGTESTQAPCLISRFTLNDPTTLSQSYEVLTVECTVTTTGFESQVRLTCPSLTGIANWNVSVDAFDTFFAPNTATTVTSSSPLINEELKWEPAYYTDISNCRNNFLRELRQIAAPFDTLSEAVAILKTLPDPPIYLESRLLGFQLTRVVALIRDLQRNNNSEIAEKIYQFVEYRYAPVLRLLVKLPWALQHGSIDSASRQK